MVVRPAQPQKHTGMYCGGVGKALTRCSSTWRAAASASGCNLFCSDACIPVCCGVNRAPLHDPIRNLLLAREPVCPPSHAVQALEGETQIATSGDERRGASCFTSAALKVSATPSNQLQLAHTCRWLRRVARGDSEGLQRSAALSASGLRRQS